MMPEERAIRILIVDDEEDFLEPISYWLRSHGYNVTTAMSGTKMAEILSKEKFDIMFLDINMQPMDGFECLKKAKEINPELPVIMLTAHADITSESKARQLGADGFFYKGLEFTQAVRAIRTILEK
jgi:two-component system NtrC family response regulator